MIENFNNIFFLILHLVIIVLLSIFLFRIFFFPHELVKENNVDRSGILPLRYIGSFVFAFVFMGIYILFRPNGPEGTWIFYNLFFLVTFVQLIYDLMFYFKFIDKDIGAKNSIVDLIFAFAAFIISVILIYGLSNKIYL